MEDSGAEDGGTDGSVDASEEDAGPVCNTAEAPIATILSPIATNDPASADVVIGNRVTVECRVTVGDSPEARPVDPESVTIVRLDGDGMVADSPTVVAEASVFRAAFNLEGLNSGAMRFRCTAQDIDAMPRCAEDEIETLVDLGPQITVLMPNAGSIHTGRMDLRYSVSPAPLVEGDTLAEVAEHTLTVAGVEITDIEETEPGTYRADIDFSDMTVFEEELAGEFEFSVEATNMRTPSPGTSRHVQPFVIDRTGPTIEFLTPDAGELIGGRARVHVSAMDPAEVDDSTVILRVGRLELNMRRIGGTDEFEVFFDAATFPSTITELTLNVTAADSVGNRLTASQIVKLDAVPPIASLDPPMVRASRLLSERLQCSPLFDPLGDDSVNDGQIVGTAAEFRARVEDMTNEGTGGTSVLFHAGNRSAEIYFLDDSDQALLVDTNDDGVCDSINPDVEPVAGDPTTAVVLELEGIRPTGTIFLPPDLDFTGGTPATAYAGGSIYGDCVSGTSPSVPRQLCRESSPLGVVISPRIASTTERAIYGKPVVTPLTCIGDSFDFQGSLNEGWACAAVRTEDNLGNIGVSPAMRVCFSDGVAPSSCPGEIGDIVTTDLPSCTDGCTPPRSFVDVPRYQLIPP